AGVEEKNEYDREQDLEINVGMVKKKSERIANWKTPGMDGVQGYWIKYLTNCHERIAVQLNEMLNGFAEIPQWLTYGRTVLCVKDPKKGNVADNFRPISCLPIMWKLFTGVIADSLYDSMEEKKVLPTEQKGCKRGSRGTKDQLLIDKLVLKDSKKRRTNLAMAWIDYRKAYDMVPHSWIEECLEIFGCAANVGQFIKESMRGWRCELAAGGEVLGDVRIKRGIFQGDSLSPLLFVICMIPLTLVLRENEAGYELKDGGGKVNHLLFMDDLKLFGKNETQIESLVDTVQLVSRDVGMEFGIKKCGVLCLKRGVVVECEGIELPDGEVMRSVESEGYKYLGILEMDNILSAQMKEKVKREYLRRVRAVLESRLHGRNKIVGINTWAIALLRYGGGILDWKKEELQSLDRKTRKLMTIHGAFHPKSDVDRLYLSRKRGGRGLLGCERSIKAEENSLGWYVKKSVEPLLKAVGRSKILDVEGSRPKESYKQLEMVATEERWIGKRMYGQYYREMSEGADIHMTWTWLQKSDIKPETEALICAAQEQALRTNYIK
uniref:Reverse transcriptase domain-containing protein n=1 Tax=Amphimedon queenslandica TaxID=400682 RepID=A0A1X7SMI5_AMPQE